MTDEPWDYEDAAAARVARLERTEVLLRARVAELEGWMRDIIEAAENPVLDLTRNIAEFARRALSSGAQTGEGVSGG